MSIRSHLRPPSIRAVAVASILSLLVLEPVQAAAAAPRAGCPHFAAPEFRGVVPTPKDVLGMAIGQRELNVQETYAYIDAVDAASDRVRQGTYGTTALSKDLRYVLVGQQDAIADAALELNHDRIRRLQDPSTSDATARSLAEKVRPFLFIGANVHGNEESGTDASMRLLYHLADRRDCAATRILRNAVVVILPIQNPDGRRLEYRRNSLGFDMNRDGLGRTQVEIDERWDLMRRFPPQLFVDAHEFGYTRSFFPPNDDPVYHEVTSPVLRWINGWYGSALADLFDERGWSFFNAGGYDLFAPVYGDSVPVLAFQAPAMTLETYNGAPIALRARKNFDQFWVLLQVSVDHRRQILIGQHDAFQEALRQGRQGLLEPNMVQRPHSTLRVEVPDVRVRNYFLEPGGNPWATAHVIDLLRSADVDVFRLRTPLVVADFQPYVGSPGRRKLPRGTYWIPAAQAQKHWVQTLLNRDTWVPVGQTYDMTGWSLPLLADLDGGWSGRPVSPDASAVGSVGTPPWRLDPRPGRRVAIFQTTRGVYGFEGAGQLGWLFDEVWGIPYEVLTTDDIRAGGLDGVDVLVTPSGGSLTAIAGLGPSGVRTLKRWVAAGGHYVGYKFGGATLPPKIGLTGARLIDSPTGIEEGALVRIELGRGPLRAGVGSDAWVLFNDDDVFLASEATSAAMFPSASDFDASGLVRGLGPLPGSTAIVDEAYRGGRVTVFGYDVNFRGMTWGSQRILWNAIYGPRPGDLATSRPLQIERAMRSAAGARDGSRPTNLE